MAAEEYLLLIERLAARPILCTDAAADKVRATSRAKKGRDVIYNILYKILHNV